MDLRALVIDWMSRAGLTANKLAKLSGVPSRSVYAFVNGEQSLNSDHLGRLLDALGVKLFDAGQLSWHVYQATAELREQHAQMAAILTPRVLPPPDPWGIDPLSDDEIRQLLGPRRRWHRPSEQSKPPQSGG